MSDRFDLTHPDVAHLLRFIQAGVIVRRQLLTHGATPKDIERMLRHKELRQVHRGVYVTTPAS